MVDPQAPNDTQDARHIVHVGDLRGGRNGQDPPASLTEDQCSEAVNCDWNNGSKIAGRRRLGCVPLDMTGSTMAAPVQSLHRNVPSSDETQAEMWAADAHDTINRLSRGFRPNLTAQFDTVADTGVWTPHTTFDPSSVLVVNQRVKVDGNVYTINAVSSTSFTTDQRSSINYTATNVSPEGAIWTAPALVDAMTGPTIETSWAALDNKLFIANQFVLDTFGHNRQHLWDPQANNAAGLIRRAGIAPSLKAPTAANEGSNSHYTDTTPRFYRNRWVERRFIPGFSNPLSANGNVIQQIIMTAGNTQYVAGLSLGDTSGNVTLTMSHTVTVNVCAAAAGGGGGGSDGSTRAGGAGGGGGASSNAGWSAILQAGKTYTLRVGTPGAAGAGATAGANGGDTFLYNVTDSTYVFHYEGGKGGASAGSGSMLPGGNGGAVLVGAGAVGGNGGSSNSGGGISNTVHYLLAAGAGAGGAGGAEACGGGAGKIATGTMVLSTGRYPITIGKGGLGAVGQNKGGDGTASVFNGLTAPAGLGGDAGGLDSHPHGGGTSGSGNLGGDTYSGYPQQGGGGAGESGAGVSAPIPPGSTIAANGGPGIISSISGSSLGYGGGGGGAVRSNPDGLSAGEGPDGAGDGGGDTGGSARPNSGAGGGGGNIQGGNGADGVLVISYPTGSISISGGTTIIDGSNTIHTFIATDVLIVNPSGGGMSGSAGAAGGGGAGGVGTGGLFVDAPSAGYAGGGSGAEAGQPSDVWDGVPGHLAHGGRGGFGGGVRLLVPGFADVTVGAGAPGAGGYPSGSSSGQVGKSGWVILYFTAQTWVDGPAYDVASGNTIWTPHVAGVNPSLTLVAGQEFLANGTVYTIATVNTSALTTTAASGTTFTNQLIQPQQSIVYRRSEPSPAVAFTANGTSDGVLITPPFRPSDGENWWELEASVDDASYYVVNTVPVGVSSVIDIDTYDANGSFQLNDLSDTIGTYNVPRPYKFVAGDQNRMLGFGSREPGDVQNRVEYSAVRGSLNIGDTERVPTDNFRDLDENDSGQPTGLVGPIFNQFFAFKTNQTWAFTPTGNTVIFSANAISKTIGALPGTIVVGEDESGNPCLYWWSLNGPYRYIVNPYGVGRMDYIGGSLQDRLDGTVSSLAFSTVVDPALGLNLSFNRAVYYPFLRQVWFYMLTSTHGVYTKFVFNIGRSDTAVAAGYRSGWSIHDGASVGPGCVLFSRSVASEMSHDLCPYVAPAGVNNTIWQCDVPGVYTDAGTRYQATITSRAFTSGLHRNSKVNRCYALAAASNGAVLTQVISGDYGNGSTNSAVTHVSNNVNQFVRHRFHDAGITDVGAFQMVWGDASPLDQHWTFAEFVFEVMPLEFG